MTSLKPAESDLTRNKRSPTSASQSASYLFPLLVELCAHMRVGPSFGILGPLRECCKGRHSRGDLQQRSAPGRRAPSRQASRCNEGRCFIVAHSRRPRKPLHKRRSPQVPTSAQQPSPRPNMSVRPGLGPGPGSTNPSLPAARTRGSSHLRRGRPMRLHLRLPHMPGGVPIGRHNSAYTSPHW